jgi:myo-inositol-1(or 4)-monophosphatase
VEYVVTIDPIDGTENFVSGLKEWGFGISVYRNMKHEQSLVALPELDICLCTGDKLDKNKNSRICGLSSYMTPQDFEMLDKGMEFRIMGCCMYNMYNVIKGSYKQFQHLKGCYSWDILPGLNLALENGLLPIVGGKKYEGEFLYPDVKYQLFIKN